MVIVIPLALILGFCLLRQRANGWRESLLCSALGIGVWTVGITEILSCNKALTMNGVLVAWGALLLVLMYFFIKQRAWACIADGRVSNLSVDTWIYGSGILLICLAVGFAAYMGAPNTADSMGYHLSRVEHWIQNHSLAYYPTIDLRQLSYPPFAEMFILHLRLLTQGDQLVNFVQFFSMIFSLVGVSLIARGFGLSLQGQWLSALVCATIPMGLLQATSTQTDYVAALWLVCAAYFAGELRQRITNLAMLGLALSLALGFLTKGYLYLFAFPLVIWALLSRASGTWRSKSSVLAGILIATLLLNAGYYQRNYSLFKSPMGTSEELVNKPVSLEALGANILRNLGLHLATPWPEINQWQRTRLEEMAHVLHINLNLPGASFGGGEFVINKLAMNEDVDGNPCHLLLLFLAFAVVLLPFRAKRVGTTSFALMLATMFVLFSLILRFQPWHSRFHLPLFVLASPLIASSLISILGERWIKVVALWLFIAAWPWVLNSHYRPMIGQPRTILNTPRALQYYAHDAPLAIHYGMVARALNTTTCRSIGLLGVPFEYPLWVAFNPEFKNTFRLEHVELNNVSNKLSYPLGDFKPCAILGLNDRRTMITVGDGIYQQASVIDLPGGGYSAVLMRVN